MRNMADFIKERYCMAFKYTKIFWYSSRSHSIKKKLELTNVFLSSRGCILSAELQQAVQCETGRLECRRASRANRAAPAPRERGGSRWR